jgi:hypothetical protein
LDPFDQNDDATLNDALRAPGLFSLQTAAEEAGLTSDSEIASFCRTTPNYRFG